jgi:hypothetical protein
LCEGDKFNLKHKIRWEENYAEKLTGDQINQPYDETNSKVVSGGCFRALGIKGDMIKNKL